MPCRLGLLLYEVPWIVNSLSEAYAQLCIWYRAAVAIRRAWARSTSLIVWLICGPLWRSDQQTSCLLNAHIIFLYTQTVKQDSFQLVLWSLALFLWTLLLCSAMSGERSKLSLQRLMIVMMIPIYSHQSRLIIWPSVLSSRLEYTRVHSLIYSHQSRLIIWPSV